MRRILNTIINLRMTFLVLSFGCLIVVFGIGSVEGSTGLFKSDPDPIYEGGGDVTFSTYESYTEYRWWISDGPGNYCTLTDTPDTNATFTRTMIESGDWEVCLEVPDTSFPGDYDLEKQTVKVSNLAPTIEDSYLWTVTPESPYVGFPFHVEVPFTDYEDSGYTCTVNYGDESGELEGTVEHVSDHAWRCVGPNHTYASAGEYIVSATIYDIQMESNTGSYDYITVNHLFTWDPIEPREQRSATFEAISGNYSYSWTRGYNPGSTCAYDPYSFGSTNPVEILFGSDGSYQVCLSLYNDDTDETITDNQWVTVQNWPILIYYADTYPNPSLINQQVNASFGFSYEGTEDEFTCQINWGDSTGVETGTFDPERWMCTFPAHSYTLVGSYNIQVTVVDGNGVSDTVSFTHSVIHLYAEGEAWLASNNGTTRITLYGYGPIGTTSMAFETNASGLYGSLGDPEFIGCTYAVYKDAMECKAEVVYTLIDPGFIGNTSFRFSVKDTSDNSSQPADIYLHIITNTKPTANSLITSVLAGQPSQFVISGSDMDVVGYDLDYLSFRLNPDDPPDHGTLEFVGDPIREEIFLPGEFYPDGANWYQLVTYTPAPGTTETEDSFSFFVNDSHQDSDMGIVTLFFHTPRTLTVNSNDDVTELQRCDPSHCSLREAIEDAQIGDTITFAPDLSSTITLTQGELLIDKSIQINGPGADELSVSAGFGMYVPVDPNNYFRVFHIYTNHLPIDVSISGLTIRDGRYGPDDDYRKPQGLGGGVFVNRDTKLVMNDCVIGPNNIVTVAGGGIASYKANLTLNNCTVVGNHGTGTTGGAGIFADNGTLTIINSTITGNVTNTYGGGIYAQNLDKFTLLHSTVTNNTANEDHLTNNFGGAGGIIIENSYIEMKNSIVAGNHDLTDPPSHAPWSDVRGTVKSLGGNLIGEGTGSTGWVSSDLVGNATAQINPMFGPFGPHSPGTTPTFPLMGESPAIDAASCITGITTDQRGVTRPQGFSCDIGAFELENPFKFLFLPLISR